MDWFASPLQLAVTTASFYAWAIAELVNGSIIGRRNRRGPSLDRGSGWLIRFGIYGAFAALIAVRSRGLGLIPHAAQWAGIAFVWLGIGLREWAILSLGRAFTVVVQVASDQHLITIGPYRWARHPAYTGTLVTLGAFGLAVGSWAAALVAVGICLAAYEYRVRTEERAMLAAFGDEYRAYMSRTGRFLPRLLRHSP